MVLTWAPVASRLAIPIVVTAVLLNQLTIEEFGLYSRVLRTSDVVLSIAKGEGVNPESYDYIIIGAGSSGAVLAKRLTESGKLRVLLLDRGGDPNPVSDIPFTLNFVAQSDMTEKYQSVPQQNACLDQGGNCSFLRGISLGGSSSVNGMVYNRCNAKDYDQWANFTQDPIWNSQSVTLAFQAVENYHGWYDNNHGLTHGTKGEMHIEKMRFLPGAEPFFAALAEKGYPINDINSLVSQTGFSKIDYNMNHGIRWGTYHAFIEPILKRENLKIYRYSRATKIHLDDQKRAVGVTYERHGQKRYVSANKEVILSAGAIDSPKLLLLSGIGAESELSGHGIEPVLNLPSVGRYLQDHVIVTLPHFALNSTFGKANYESPASILQFVETGSGPYQWISFTDGFAVLLGMGYISSKGNKDKSWPDIHIYIQEQVIGTEETLQAIVVLVKPEQTGTVRLGSSNPEVDPLIDPQMFGNRYDLERTIDGMEEMADFFLNSPVYKSLGIRWSDNFQSPPECDKFKFATRDYWRCYAPIRSLGSLHPTSTCRMGTHPSVSVVDSRLRVFGTTGLRVIDASVMPFVPNGNTNFPSIMVGEMGAKIILNQI